MNLLKNKLQILVSLILIGYVGWWVSFQHVLDAQGNSTQWFGRTYGVIALIGAIIGFITARRWGGFKTILGKALFFLSLGLLAQEAGQLILAYYINVAKIQIPYPSWGDVAYFGSTLSYICGAYYLTKAVGVKFTIKTNRYKIIAFIIPAILLIASYWVFLHNHQYDWHHPVTVFLDVGYPLGDAVYISMALIAYLLSRKILGGIMKAGALIIILALFAQYIADWTFLYQSSRATYVPAGYDDLFYLISYFVMATALIRFQAVYGDLKQKTTAAKAAKENN